MDAVLAAYMCTEHGVFPEDTVSRPRHEKIFMMVALEEKFKKKA